MVEIALKGAACGSGEPVFRLWQAAIEQFCAVDVRGLFQLACMHGKISVGGSEQGFELVEGERRIDGQRADNAQTHAFVDEAVQSRGQWFRALARHGGEMWLLKASLGDTFRSRGSQLGSHVTSSSGRNCQSSAAIFPGNDQPEYNLQSAKAGDHVGVAP